MALIECPECGGSVSDKSDVCIHCGYPMHTSSTIQDKYKIFITSCGNNELYVSTLLYCDLGYNQDETDYILTALPVMIADNISEKQTAAIIKRLKNKDIAFSVMDKLDNFVDVDKLDKEYADDISIEFLNSKQKYVLPINGTNMPKCPTCKSTNIQKISLSDKAIGGALFGLFSSNVRNTMKCNNCGYKW